MCTLVRVGNEFIQDTTAVGTPRTRDSSTDGKHNSPKGELKKTPTQVINVTLYNRVSLITLHNINQTFPYISPTTFN